MHLNSSARDNEIVGSSESKEESKNWLFNAGCISFREFMKTGWCTTRRAITAAANTVGSRAYVSKESTNKKDDN
jgi:hypothetical protein